MTPEISIYIVGASIFLSEIVKKKRKNGCSGAQEGPGAGKGGGFFARIIPVPKLHTLRRRRKNLIFMLNSLIKI